MIRFDFVKDDWWFCGTKIGWVKVGDSWNSLPHEYLCGHRDGKEQVNWGSI